MVKKVIIIVLLILSLCLIIFQQQDVREIVELSVGESGVFWGYIISFYLVSSVLLFWVGIPAGWNLAKERFWGIWGALICAFIGMYLSLPIAIFQLFKPTD